MQVLLPVMIYTAGPISGAHFNPMVTSVFMMARMQVLLLTTLTASHIFCTHMLLMLAVSLSTQARKHIEKKLWL